MGPYSTHSPPKKRAKKFTPVKMYPLFPKLEIKNPDEKKLYFQTAEIGESNQNVGSTET